MKKKSKTLLYVLIPIILIQFIPINRNNPPVDNNLVISTPKDVEVILKNSCYDCHSNETVWPVYSYIAPISWLVAKDVKNGREELNFSEWNKLDDSKMEKKKEEIIEEISRDTMPLPIYLITHPSAKLSEDDKLLLKNWLTGR
ncbi:MAG: heme-binding protein [Ignavibacteriales bacterium CG18_big_fil_WC_8_21_14_2_50_31_20]|nr:MAG: heme-binding protein [Ignavibacteriales bacterium CG18_big_fil_WC_8_21_14_2_50_31_20]